MNLILSTFLNESGEEFILCDSEGQIYQFESTKEALNPLNYRNLKIGHTNLIANLFEALMKTKALVVSFEDLQKEISIPFTIKMNQCDFGVVYGILIPEGSRLLRSTEDLAGVQ